MLTEKERKVARRRSQRRARAWAAADAALAEALAAAGLRSDKNTVDAVTAELDARQHDVRRVRQGS